MDEQDIIDKAISVTIAYISRNHIPVSNLPILIRDTHKIISQIARESESYTSVRSSLSSTQIAESIQNDYLVSFIDGNQYQTLKRHLTANGLTPERYRAQYSLPENYPMVAPNYSDVRRRIAKETKLGKKAV